jgi:hypothetical protein
MAGRPVVTEQYEAIPPSVFMDDRICITVQGDVGPDPYDSESRYEYRGPRFHDIRFYTVDVLAVWREPGDTRGGKREQVAAPPSSRRSIGGRPAKHDWEQFWIEVALYAAKNDLDPELRTELQRHMRKWAAKNWADPPDDPTIRRRIKRLFDARAIARD